jgi:hypothetical protein
MVWPSKLTDLDHAGFSYTGIGKICDCGTRTLFFVTPERKHVELSALRDSRLVPHQSICVRVKELGATTRRQGDGARNAVQPLLFSEKNAAAPAIRSSARPRRTAGRIFGGAAYVPSLDRTRLSLQVERLRGYILGVEWRTLREIKAALEDVYAPALFPESSISAQLRNLKKPPYFYRLMKRRRVGVHGPGAGIWEYKLLPPAPAALMPAASLTMGKAARSFPVLMLDLIRARTSARKKRGKFSMLDKVDGLIRRAQEFGLRLEYRSGFLIATRPTSTDRRREDLVEMEQEILEQLGKRLAEVRASVIAMARARGKELVGQGVFIPIIGIGERTLQDPEGRVMRSQISGKLTAFSEEGQLTVSYVETRDDERIEHTTTCAFDEAFFIILGNGGQPDRASSFASIRNEKIVRALERGQSIGLTLELDAGLAVAKWNVAPGDQAAGEEILRELGPPRGELLSVLEGIARGAAGSEFVGQQVFVPTFDSFGVIRSCDLDGDLDVTYENKDLGSPLTCRCGGSDVLIIAGEEAARSSSADPKSAAPKNFLRRVFGS